MRHSLPWIVFHIGITGALFGCSGPGQDGLELSPFAEDVLSSGSVLENSTACVVDAVCYLRIEFADASIVAVYGSGERPANDCRTPSAVSDVAFQVEDGDRVDVVVSRCSAVGYFLRQLARTNG